ncbi:hypothetical protein OG542_36890 [Streptomyces violaceus]|uniref:hypothetical protein n=1 Tax=Streptomyces violaceus TaxID=1936 RepID=UPI002E1E7C29
MPERSDPAQPHRRRADVLTTAEEGVTLPGLLVARVGLERRNRAKSLARHMAPEDARSPLGDRTPPCGLAALAPGRRADAGPPRARRRHRRGRAAERDW